MEKRFEVYDTALGMVYALRPAVEALARSNRDLAYQIRRAGSSVVLNLAEGSRRRGRDRMHFYRIAAGSAAEVRGALQVGLAWGCLGAGMVAEADALLDRILAMLWRLTHGPE